MTRITKYISYIERCGLQYRNAEFVELGLSGSNHMYIFYLCRHPGVSQETLSKMLHINKSNVARSLKNLEEEGFIEKKNDEVDKRLLHIFPTDRAFQILPRIIEKMNYWNSYITKGLTAEEMEIICKLLDKIMENACQYHDLSMDIGEEE